MGTKEKAYNAFKATRALGLPDVEVKSVLKHLLKVFNKNWEPIEDDNYRALIDTYFEMKENTEAEDVKNHVREDGPSEVRPFKRVIFEEQGDQISSSTDNACYTLALEEKDVISMTTCRKGNIEPWSDSVRIESTSSMPGTNVTGEVKDNISCQMVTRDIYSTSGKHIWIQRTDIPNATDDHNRKVVKKARAMRILRDLDDSEDFEDPIAVVHPQAGTMEGSSTGNYFASYPTSQCDVSGSDAIILCQRASRVGDSNVILEKKASNASRISNSCGVVNFQLGTIHDGKRCFHNLSDITKGRENVKISLVDEIGNVDLPKFTYTPHNIIYQNALMLISLARIADVDCCSSCIGDCLSPSIPCACAAETGGEFAYTKQGLLKEEFLSMCMSMRGNPQDHHSVFCQDCPFEQARNEQMPHHCKGHIVRKFVKECWIKCGCSMDCGNRVVQRGIRCNLQVFLTHEGKGWGLRTLQDLPKGTFVCEYVGEILTNTELYERNMQRDGNDRHTYPVTLDADWGSERILRDEEALCLDATHTGNVARFINHRCFDANLIDIPVEVETPDRHYYHLAFFTTREVSAGEELSWDYGIDFSDHDHPIKAFQCQCGSAFCRDGKQKRNKLIALK